MVVVKVLMSQGWLADPLALDDPPNGPSGQSGPSGLGMSKGKGRFSAHVIVPTP